MSSTVKIEHHVCEQCKTDNTIPLWTYIDVEADPDARERILHGTLYAHQCPKCGYKMMVNYPSLYHDPTEKFMIYYLPGLKIDQRDLSGLQLPPEALLSMGVMHEYRLRIAAYPAELVEKIHLLEDGHEDRAVEICKYMALKRLREERKSYTPVAWHFARRENEDILDCIDAHGQAGRVGFSSELYDRFCDEMIKRQDDIGFQRIDLRWVQDIYGMASAAAAGNKAETDGGDEEDDNPQD